jgi:multicomponent Na+:H+ antiporter subunit B
MNPALRRWIFLAGLAGLVAFYLWGLTGLPAFGHYHGPYGTIINRIAVGQTNATGVVSAVNFDYRAIDTLGEEFILFIAAAGVGTVLRHLRDEREQQAEEAGGEGASAGAGGRGVPAPTDATRLAALVMVGPAVLMGWYLAAHAQTSPSGGFQGGVVLATAFILIYLAGQFLVFRRLSPVDVTDAVEAVGAGGFGAVGLIAVFTGVAFLTNVLPLGSDPGAVSSSGTIALISFFVGLEVAAAFILIVSELLDQALLIRQEHR